MHRIIHHPRLRGAAQRIEAVWDRLHLGARRRFGQIGPALILPYRKFGTPERLRIAGRVIEDRGVINAAHSESTWDNVRLTLKRYGSREIPGARVSYSVAGQSAEVLTDEEGFFEIDLTLPAALPIEPGRIWVPVELELLAAPPALPRSLSAKAEVLVPPAHARFGVISDIDDTIVKTGATNFLKHWRIVVANSAESRVAFPGLAPFYRALQRGGGHDPVNPIFYVSSSPWNLYDLFERYLALHDIPLGPILLKDLGLDAAKWLTGGHDTHKLSQIDTVLATYPQLRFILVGDSGQRDPAIYAEAASRYPGRIAAIYIRDVTPAPRDAEVSKSLADLQAAGIPTAYGPDLMEAAEHAATAGFIGADALAEIRAAIRDPDRPGA